MTGQNSDYLHSNSGFLLVDTKPARERDVYLFLREKSKEVKGVNSVDVQPLFGEWDIIIKVEAKDHDALGEYENFVKQAHGVSQVRMLYLASQGNFK